MIKQPGPNDAIIGKKDKLKRLIAPMSVPKRYRDLSMTSVWWLHRNLGIKNSKHENYDEAVKAIREFLNI